LDTGIVDNSLPCDLCVFVLRSAHRHVLHVTFLQRYLDAAAAGAAEYSSRDEQEWSSGDGQGLLARCACVQACAHFV